MAKEALGFLDENEAVVAFSSNISGNRAELSRPRMAFLRKERPFWCRYPQHRQKYNGSIILRKSIHESVKYVLHADVVAADIFDK